MTDSANNAGITKESTLIVDLPDYPPTSSQKTLNLVANTTTAQTIYPPTGEYWNSIRYSVNVPNPTYPTVTFNTITSNNTTYTLSQLTSNTSSYFSRSSTIKCNISLTTSYDKDNFYFKKGSSYILLELKRATSKPSITIYGNCIFYFWNTTINGKSYMNWYFYENRGYSSNTAWPFENVTYPIYWNYRDDFLEYSYSDTVSQYNLYYKNGSVYEPLISNGLYWTAGEVNRGEHIYFPNCQIIN